MKNLILFLAVTLITSSCITEKKRRAICDGCPVRIVVKDSIVEKIVPYPYSLPPVAGPTVYLNSPCDSNGKVKKFVYEQKKNGIKTTVKGDSSGLVIQSNFEDSLKGILNVKQKEIYSKQVNDVRVDCNCNNITPWQQFCVIGFYILCSIIALIVLAYLLKKRFLG